MAIIEVFGNYLSNDENQLYKESTLFEYLWNFTESVSKLEITFLMKVAKLGKNRGAR